MLGHITCPWCRIGGKIRQEHIGRLVTCKRCRKPFLSKRRPRPRLASSRLAAAALLVPTLCVVLGCLSAARTATAAPIAKV